LEAIVTNESSEDTKKKSIEKMGEPLGARFNALWQEIALLHLNWQEYVVLFGTNERRIERLNQSAPAFFRMIQDELWSTTLLHLARLTDAPRSVGKSNLTIRNLTDLVDQTLKMPVAELIDKAIIATAFARDWRNRVIAHRDLSLALEGGVAAPLQPASRSDVKTAMERLADVMNKVQAHYMKSETAYHAASRHNGALNLLHLLGEGLNAKSKHEERLKLAIEVGSAEEIRKAMEERAAPDQI
jgi:hypothetical protein